MPILRLGLFLLLFFGLGRIVSRVGRRFRGATPRTTTHPFFYTVRRQKRQVSGIELGVEMPDTLRFELRREGALDELGKWLGLVHEIQSGEAAFDRTLYVVGEHPGLEQLLTTDAEWRSTVMTLFRRPDVQRLNCERGYLWLTLDAPYEGADIKDDAVVADQAAEHSLPALIACRDRLARLTTEPWSDETDPAVRHASLMYGITALLALIGAVSFFVHLNSDTVLPRALESGGVMRLATLAAVSSGAVLALGAFLLLRASSRLHRVLLEVIASAMPGVWLLSYDLLIDYNQRADRSIASVEVRRVEEAFERKGRGGPRYYVVLDRRPQYLDSSKLPVTRAKYGRLSVGACLSLETRGGALGDQWLVDIEATACP
jgi:hypothetical protein